MENPYITRTPVKDPEGFYGREGIMKRIFEDTARKQMQSHCIIGERRIGKTSLLNQLLTRDVKKKYIDANIESFVFVGTDVTLFPNAPPAAFFDEWAKAVSKTSGTVLTEPGYMNFRTFVRDVTETGLKIIILLDEFEATASNKNIDRGFFEFIRALTQNYDISFILFSRTPLQHLLREEKFRSTFSSPFFNALNISYLKFLEESEAKRLVIEPSRRAGVDLVDHVDFILEQAYYHPFLLQTLSSIVFNHKRSSDINQEKILKEFADQTEEFFSYLWQHSDSSEKEALKKLASYDYDIPKPVSDNFDRRSLLTEDRTRIFCPSFEAFIKEHT
ncbi:MAG: ATP-binding protein [Theionarchaea archaeon]|nr:ATP-binding protein [Theionarchaea archaeon]